MKKAELQYRRVLDLEHPEINISSIDVALTLTHLVEVINEMQGEICDRVKYDEQ